MTAWVGVSLHDGTGELEAPSEPESPAQRDDGIILAMADKHGQPVHGGDGLAGGQIAAQDDKRPRDRKKRARSVGGGHQSALAESAQHQAGGVQSVLLDEPLQGG